MLIDGWFRKHGWRDAVTLEVYAAEPAPMGVAGPHVSSAVMQLLASKGIPYHPGHQVTAADAGQAQSARFDGRGDCFIEIGGGEAGMGGGNFYAEPTPDVTLRPPGWWWHLGKVWVEKSWLYGKL